ncbi:MAG: hypothetical protein ACK2US_12630 [Anaerolineae bacterium]
MRKKLLILLCTFLGAALLSGGVAVGVALARTETGAAQAAAASTDLSTAFTYQGKLESGGVAVNDTCDFRFRLYDAASGGNPVGITVTHTSVAVTQGLFSVQLDFGDGPFNGDDRYLETAVRCSGDPTYTTLITRQPLTPAPYDLYQQRQLDYLAVPGYLPGLVGQVDMKDCVKTEVDGMDCEEKRALTIAVQEGDQVHIEGAHVFIDDPCGDEPCPTVVTHTLRITMTKESLPNAQTSKDFEVTITVTNVDTGANVTFSLSPDHPLWDGNNEGAPIDIRATLLTDSLVQLAVDMTDVKYVISESIASFTAAGTYQPGANQAEMVVQVNNNGDLQTNYLVTVRDCTLPADPVMPQGVTLDPGESRELVFTVNASQAFAAVDGCLVQLQSPAGRLYDEQIITFAEAAP